MRKDSNYAIDVLKILFMFFIVLHHSRQASSVLKRGYIGVEFFFIISGVLLMRTKEYNIDLSTINYIKKRISKLYPHYFLSFVVMFISVNVFRTGGINFKQIIGSLPELFLIQNIGIFDGGVNYPCWYLSVLIFASLSIYALSKSVSKKIFNIIATICVIIIYSYIAIRYRKIETFDRVICFYLPFWRGIAGMFLGCLIFEISEILNKEFYNKYKMIIHLSELIILVLVILLMFIGESLDFIEIICISILVLLILNSNSVINTFGKNKITRWLSRYEYAIFLNHAFIIGMFNKLIGDKYTMPAYINVIIILCLLIGYSIMTNFWINYCRNKIERVYRWN